MGYCIRLTTKKKFKEKDIEGIIKNLPDDLKGPIDRIGRQVWGWPCNCDVRLVDNHCIDISGAWAISGNKAQAFCEYFKVNLDKLGYETKMDTSDLAPVSSKEDYDRRVMGILNTVEEGTKKAAEEWNKEVNAIHITAKAPDISEFTKSTECSHCGKNIEDSYTRYCERCYQLLIAKNAQLQLQLKNSVPVGLVQNLLEDLRVELIQPQDLEHNAETKIKHCCEIYMKYISQIGGVDSWEHKMS